MFYEVVIDRGETANKCTIAPLSTRKDFTLFPFKGATPLGPLRANILLHHEGIDIREMPRPVGKELGIACVDCVWGRLDVLLNRIAGELPIRVRIPDGFVTAYPRRSEKNTDPDAGLATIEAIFIAAAFLGNWDVSLLSEYHFGRKFVQLNLQRFLDLGITQAKDWELIPMPEKRSRTSLQRRKDRGKRTS